MYTQEEPLIVSFIFCPRTIVVVVVVEAVADVDVAVTFDAGAAIAVSVMLMVMLLMVDVDGVFDVRDIAVSVSADGTVAVPGGDVVDVDGDSGDVVDVVVGCCCWMLMLMG